MGPVQVDGAIELKQYFPVGRSDADTTSVRVRVDPTSFIRWFAHYAPSALAGGRSVVYALVEAPAVACDRGGREFGGLELALGVSMASLSQRCPPQASQPPEAGGVSV
jgi:hypothetical protein